MRNCIHKAGGTFLQLDTDDGSYSCCCQDGQKCMQAYDIIHGLGGKCRFTDMEEEWVNGIGEG